jgi:GWxTD domain-containing protein
VLFEHATRVRPPHTTCGALRALDVSRLAAGTYTVEIQARPAASPAQAVRPGPSAVSEPAGGECVTVSGRFQVHWDAGAWRRSRHDRVEEASLLLQGESWERFVALEPGQQEAMLDSVWTDLGGRIDDFSRAELVARFRQRLVVADARYGGRRRGALADRGRVYVHFGEPDEIHKELTPQDEDLIYNFVHREVDAWDAAATGGMPRVHWLSTAAYQVWYYNHRGDPLLPEQALRVRGGELRFIFVDQMGTGDYRLLYTNLFGGSI